jgi:hypothetical protein
MKDFDAVSPIEELLSMNQPSRPTGWLKHKKMQERRKGVQKKHVQRKKKRSSDQQAPNTSNVERLVLAREKK